MTKKLIYLTSCFLVLVLAGTNVVSGAYVLDIRVTGSNNDIEEHIDSGSVDITSSDLEMPYENEGKSAPQTIGLRFTGVDVPNGAIIKNAYVEFECDELKDGSLPVSLLIEGELSPDAAMFADESYNVTSRPRTAAKVVWVPAFWTADSQRDQTSNIASVIEEIISQDGWVSGNALVLIISDDPANPSEGNRCAEASDGESANAPLLHIEYVLSQASNPNPPDGGTGGPAPLLQWEKGGTAVYHDVYLDTDKLAVEAADISDTTGVYQGRWTWAMYWHIPGLEPGTTYYWRVDEVEADGTTIYKGDVWTFTAVSYTAHSPDPPDGDKTVLPDAVLSWGAGITAATHDVYFGTSRADVAAGSGGTFKGNQLDVTYKAETLENNTTYYWRIDEIEADGVTKHTGEVWSFKTRKDPALIGWWKFDEGQGTVAYDSSGYGNDGILGGDPQWVTGILNGALELDGTDDYVSIDGVAPLMTHNNFSVSIWIKTQNTSGEGVVFGSNSGSSHNFIFGVNNGNLWVEDDTDTEFGSVANNQWHMITFVREGNTSWIYIDGTLKKEDPAGDDPAADLRWSIGQEWDSGPSDEFEGTVDDARFWIRPLTAEEVAEVFKGDVELAHSPKPPNGTMPDIEQVPPISWSPGEDATQHDVYFGNDELAVGGADTSDTTGIYRGRQAATSYTPPETLGWGTGPYFWRIDEVKADGTVTEGMVWSFSVGDFLNVDDFETYNDIDPPDPASNTIFGAWIDGWQVPTNGALIGNAFPPYCETRSAYVHSGKQAMPFLYDNNRVHSEAAMALTGTARDWTRQGVAELSLWFRGESSNAAERMYVSVNGKAVYHDNPNAAQVGAYEEWVIPLQTFANMGVSLNNVTSIAIGFGTPGSTAVGGSGTVYFDDIRLYQAVTAP